MIKFIKSFKTASWALFAVILGVTLLNALALSETILWVMKIFVLFIVFKNSENKMSEKRGVYIVYFFMGWLTFEALRGAYFSEGYFIIKNVINQFFLALFCMVIILSANLKVVQDYLAIYWKLMLPMIALSILFFGSPNNYDYVPFSLLMLFFGVIPKKQAWILLVLMAVYFNTIGQRNDMIKILVSSLLGIAVAYIHIYKWMFKLGQIFFLIIPIILVWLGMSGVFNVFKMDDYIKGDYTQNVTTKEGIQQDNLKADTRTFLYQNVAYTIDKYDSWLLGRSAAFGDEGVDGFWGKDETTGLTGRYGNEVGVLDILLWYGLIGVIIYFCIFIRASYLAIYKSKSKYAKAVGLYTSFMWAWSFVWEKPLFETFFMVDLILIGMCFSTRFRQLTDQEIGYWVKGIFVRSTRKVILK